MGLPSYAQPIIGECVPPISSNVSAPIAVEYPTKPYPSFSSVSTKISSPNLE